MIHSAFLQKGVLKHPIDQFLHGREIVAEIPVQLPCQDLADLWLEEQIGKPYDWTAIAGFLAWRGGWDEEDSWYCSELGAAWLAEGGVYLATEYRRVGVRLLLEVAHARARAL